MKKKRRQKRNKIWKKVWVMFGRSLLVVLILGGILAGSFLLVSRMGLLPFAIDDNALETMDQNTHEVIDFEALQKDDDGDDSQVEKENIHNNSKYGELLSDTERMKNENVYYKEGQTEDEVTLLFAGDILFDDKYAIMARALHKENRILDSISSEVKNIINEADLFMLNNEFPYSLRGVPTLGKTFTFRAKPEYVEDMKKLNVDLVSLANNHAYDYGKEALLDTFQTLEGAGIPYVGAGNNIEEAMRPLYFIVNDIKIAFVSATQIERTPNPDTKEATANEPGVFRCLDPTKLCEQIKVAKENSDFVVVYVHWGTENQTEIDWAQEQQAPMFVEAGADLIVGAHPHILQKIEYIDGVPVAFSMGNFLFNSRPLDTGMLQVTITSEGIKELKFIPCKQIGSEVRLSTQQEKASLTLSMNRISEEAVILEDGVIQKK